MKVQTVRYEKLVNLGNYENIKIGVEVMIDDGESPGEALERAKTFVDRSLNGSQDEDKYQREQYKAKLAKMEADPESYSPKEIRETGEWLDEHPGPRPVDF